MKLDWITKTPALIAINVVVFGALGGQIVYRYTDGQQTGMYMASWRDRPNSVDATTKLAEKVVRGRVTSIRKAEPLTVRIDGEPNNLDQIPIEVVTIQLIDDAAVGRDKRGQKIEVFHTGHSSTVNPAARRDRPRGGPPPRPEDGVDEATARRSMTADDRKEHLGVLFSGVMYDPAYKAGEEYVLFLRKGPDVTVGGAKLQTQAIVSPEGRYRVEGGKLRAMSPRKFAEGLNGKDAKILTDEARRAKPNR